MQVLFLPLLLLSSSHATELKPIEPYLIDYYRLAFPEVALKSEEKISDPITEGNINTSYLRVYKQGGEFLGYIREVSTTTGCDQMCKPLDFTLTFSIDQSFNKLLVMDPLTKLGHRPFTESDYTKLDSILKNNPESFKSATRPVDLVDAVTRATKPSYAGDVVPTAALTSFRIYQYEKQTIQFLSNNGTEMKIAESSLAPAFTLPDLDEKQVNFDYSLNESQFKGKVTVLLFFASWCPDCKKELPYFEKLFEKYRENSLINFVGLRTFRNRENEDIKRFVERMGLQFQILSDTPKEDPPYSKVAKLYEIKWVPTLFIIDKSGKIRHKPEVSDYPAYVETISKLLDPLLKE